MEYYVYVGVLDSVVMYVGKGVRQRINHLNSGVSSCYQANKLHFSGGQLEVYPLAYFNENIDAVSFEKELIFSLKPVWNVMLNPDADRSMFKKENTGRSYTREKGVKPVSYTSSYLGVGFYKKGVGGKRTPKKYWRATFNLNQTKCHIGFYETELEAALARDAYITENCIDLPLNFS